MSGTVLNGLHIGHIKSLNYPQNVMRIWFLCLCHILQYRLLKVKRNCEIDRF